MNRDWVNDQGHRTKKTPTSLLLKPDLSFDSFGYKAVEKYFNLKNVYEEKDYWFFQHFKMCLHNDEVSVLETVTLFQIKKKQKQAHTLKEEEEAASKQTTTSRIFSGSNADSNSIH